MRMLLSLPLHSFLRMRWHYCSSRRFDLYRLTAETKWNLPTVHKLAEQHKRANELRHKSPNQLENARSPLHKNNNLANENFCDPIHDVESAAERFIIFPWR
jgi:hypothetical protein